MIAINAIGIGVTFLVHVLLGRSLGSEAFGVYAHAWAWVQLLMIFGRAGLGTSSLRFVSAFHGQQDWARLRGFVRTTNRWLVAASSATALAMAGAVFGFRDSIGEALSATLIVGALALPSHAMVQVWSLSLRGLRRVVLSQAPGQIVQPFVLGALVLGVVLVPDVELSSSLAMGLNGISAAAAAALAAALLWRVWPAQASSVEPRTEPGEWARTAAPLLAVNAMNVLLQRSDILFLGSMTDPATTGTFAAASRIAAVLAFGLTAVNAWAGPTISRLHAAGRMEELQRFVRIALQIVFAFTIPVAVAVVWLAPDLLRLFGPGFESGSTSLVILAMGHVFNALMGPVGLLMTMTGHQNRAAKILLATVCLNVVLLPLFISWLGAEGAAIATTATRVLWNGLMAIAVYRTLRIRVSPI